MNDFDEKLQEAIEQQNQIFGYFQGQKKDLGLDVVAVRVLSFLIELRKERGGRA